MNMPSARRAAAAATAVLVLVVVWSAWQIQPPRPQREDGRPSLFSVQAAKGHMEALGQKPRIPGAPYHRVARDYLLEQLEALEMDVELQSATVVAEDRQAVPFRAAAVQNIAARLEGEDSTGTVLLAAHYDSVPTGPGAGDDLLGVAALLETARALRHVGILRNDIVFLFTDAHEYGLFGAKAFARKHPWTDDAAVVFNFEAQGPTGPVYMFEAEGARAALVRELGRAVPYPRADSLSAHVYPLLNFDNDFRIFREAGLPGLGFAALADRAYYHSALDNLDRLHPGSLQHQGFYAMGLAEHFGRLDLREPLLDEDIVYFNWGPFFVHYPAAWALPLAVLSAVLAAVLVVWGAAAGQLALSRVLTALLVQILMLAVGIAAVYGIAGWLELSPRSYGSSWYYAGFLLLGLAAALAAASVRKLDTRHLLGGAVALLGLGALSMAFLLPLGSHLLTWPALAGAAALLLTLGIGNSGGEALHRSAAVLAVLPGVLLAAPLVWILFTAMTPAYPVPGMALAGTVWVLLQPLLQPLMRWGRWWLPAAVLSLAAAAIVVAYSAGPSPERPQHYELFYVESKTEDTAYWASSQPPDHPWLQQYLGSDPERTVLEHALPHWGPYYRAETEPVGLESFSAAVVGEHSEGGRRTLDIELSSNRQAHSFAVYLEPGTKVHGTEVNGTTVTEGFSADWIWALECIGVGREPLSLRFTIPDHAELGLLVVEQSHTAPLGDVPQDWIPQPDWPYLSGAALVSQQFRF